jgi:hypothetical protein
MASIKISNLPVLTADRLTGLDQFIVNDENQTTSRLSYTELVSGITDDNLTFNGSVRFTGEVSVEVTSANTNLYTKQEVNDLIAETEADHEAGIAQNATDIVNLVALTGVPKGRSNYFTGDFAVGSFLNDGINRNNLQVLQKIESQVTNVIGVGTTNTASIAQNTAAIANVGQQLNTHITGEFAALGTQVNGHENRITDLETAVNGVNGINDDITGLSNDVVGLTTRVATNEDDIATLQTDVGQAQTTANSALGKASATNDDYRLTLTQLAAELANVVVGETVEELAVRLEAVISASLTANNSAGG